MKIRKRYERMDAMVIAKRAIERRLSAGCSGDGGNPVAAMLARRFRGERARPLDAKVEAAQTDIV
jgi:hypothetical protein